MTIVEHLVASELKTSLAASLKHMFAGGGEPSGMGFAGEVFALRPSADGGRELRLMPDVSEASRAAKDPATLLLGVSSKSVPFTVEIENLPSKEGWGCRLTLTGQWSVRRARTFLTGIGLSRLAGGAVGTEEVEQTLKTRLRGRLTTETTGWTFRELRDAEVFQAQWFERQFDGDWSDLGLSVHVGEAQWVSREAEADHAHRTASENLKRTREEELAAVRHAAGVEAIRAESAAETTRKRLETERWQALVAREQAEARRVEVRIERDRLLGEAEAARRQAACAKDEAERAYWARKAEDVADERKGWDSLLGQLAERDAKTAEALEEIRKQWAMSMEFLQVMRAERETLLAQARQSAERTPRVQFSASVRWRAFSALAENESAMQPRVRKDPLDRWDTLVSGDALQVFVTPSEDAHLYVLAVGPYADDQGRIGYEWRTLFGNACANDLSFPLFRPDGNMATGGRELCLPADAADEADFHAHSWALNLQGGGMELLFLVACRRRLADDELRRLMPPITPRVVVSTRGFQTYTDKGGDLPHPPPPRLSALVNAAARDLLGADGAVYGLTLVHQ